MKYFIFGLLVALQGCASVAGSPGALTLEPGSHNYFTTEPFLSVSPEPSHFVFYGKGGNEVFKISADGKFFLNQKEITTDLEVYKALKRFLSSACGQGEK